MIDSYLQSKTEMDDHVIHLLFSANRWEKANWIKDTIAEGYTIICDRYVYSGMIYSAAKNNPELDIGWARQCDEGLPRPDLVLFLDLDLEEAERRGGYGEEKYEKREMQERVKELFGALRYAKGDECVDMVTVDAGDEIEKVAELVWHQAVVDLKGVQDGKAGELRTIRPWEKGVVERVPEFRPQNTMKAEPRKEE
jgi:dTMP kinase